MESRTPLVAHVFSNFVTVCWIEVSAVLELVENKLHTVDDEIYLVVHALHFALDSHHFVVDLMRGLQTLCSRHPNFILRQSIQSTQRVLDVCPPNELLHVFPLPTVRQHDQFITPVINSLALPCLISFVTIERMESTSTMILTIMSVIPMVGGTST